MAWVPPTFEPFKRRSPPGSCPPRSHRLFRKLLSCFLHQTIGPFWDSLSTPFGITEVGTDRLGVGRVREGVCSTPFGITEVGTRYLAAVLASLTVCSTPFGITEVGTLWPPPRAPLTASAQRLSASQRSALNRHRRRVSRKSVLNAFRHHRGRHCIRRRNLATHNPVLNAFRHHRGRHLQGVATATGKPMCSTPFGITEVGTRPGQLLRPAHPACSTPFGITEVGTRRTGRHGRTGRVLNAFRHHRGRHGHLNAGRETESRVLNAFRHHRGRHPSAWPCSTTSLRCSTPFGITEVGTSCSLSARE